RLVLNRELLPLFAFVRSTPIASSQNASRSSPLNPLRLAVCTCRARALHSTPSQRNSSAQPPLVDISKLPHPSVRVIGPKGENLGIKPVGEVRSLFDVKEYELMLVNAKAQPPVCRFISKKERFDRARGVRKNTQPAAEVAGGAGASVTGPAVSTTATAQGKKGSDTSSRPIIGANPKTPVTAPTASLQRKKDDAGNQKRKHTGTVKEIEVGTNIGLHDLQIKIRKAQDLIQKEYRVQFTLVRKRGGNDGIMQQILNSMRGEASMCGKLRDEGRKAYVTFEKKKT
ncbi:hypothetical protein HK102_014056, partial [Quaeritorhiza haematococci]